MWPKIIHWVAIYCRGKLDTILMSNNQEMAKLGNTIWWTIMWSLKLVCRSRSVVAWAWGECGDWLQRQYSGTFRNDEDVLNLDCGYSYVSARSCPNASNHTLKMGAFIICKLYLNTFLKNSSVEKIFIKNNVPKILSEKVTKWYLQYIYFHVCYMHREEIRRKYTKITIVVIVGWWELWVI